MRSQLEGGNRFMNQTTAMERRWQVEGQQTDMPRITFQDPMGNARFSNRWIEDGSYLRLKSVTLSYDLPMKSEYLQGMQFWVHRMGVGGTYLIGPGCTDMVSYRLPDRACAKTVDAFLGIFLSRPQDY